MSYHYPPSQPPYPPYGQQGPPQPYPPYGGPPPPQMNYNRPPPPPPQQGGYPPPQGFPPGPGYPHSPPPPSHSPYAPPPQGYMPPGPGQGQFSGPPPGPGFSAPYPPPQGPPPQQQPSFHGHGGPPSFPSPGYAPGQLAPGEWRPQADQLRKAMKGFGTDERALIAVLAKLDPLQMAAVRATYSSHIGRDLYKDVRSETSSYFRQGLLAIIDGPLMHDVHMARESIEGVGTKEWLMNDVLLGRSNADLNAIKTAYEQKYHHSLQKDVEGDLSFKTLTMFTNVLRAHRKEESVPIDPRTVEEEAKSLHAATAGRMVNNVDEVCGIFARSSDTELRAINHAYSARYNAALEKHIEKEFSGHMKDALLQILRTALDPAMRDADLLEDCMRGMGTKDEKLVVRVVRLHWNRPHMDQVKRAYHHKYRRDLIERVRGETSGDYQRLMVALLE